MLYDILFIRKFSTLCWEYLLCINFCYFCKEGVSFVFPNSSSLVVYQILKTCLNFDTLES